MENDKIIALRKMSQQYAYTSIQMHEAIARKAGFSSTDHKYLGFFLQKESFTAGELAELTELTTGAVTGLIDRFEKKNLVTRKFDKNDRRKVNIVPNPTKIMDLLKPFYQEFQDETDQLFDSFTRNELDVIESYFLKALVIANKTKNKFK